MSKSSFLLLAVALAAITAGITYHVSQEKTFVDLSEPALLSASGTAYCPAAQYRSADWISNFITNLKTFNFDNDQMTYLQKTVPTDSKMISTDQTLQILSVIKFDSSRSLAIQLLTPFIVDLSSDNIVSILEMFSFSTSKMNALKLIAITLNDLSDDSKAAIISEFSFSSDKSDAKAILDAVVLRNCLYGTVTETVAAFVIDTSGSMDYKFDANGVQISRLDFVKAQLTQTIANQLKPYQKFNIISFSNSVDQWQKDYVDATPANIQKALAYIKSLSAGGATNISGGLDAAFNTKADLRGIYLLSDGVPNYGVQTVDGINSYLTKINTPRANKVKVNTISFILGGIETASERTQSFAFLNAIAFITNGSFRGINFAK